jgi:acetyl-CoA C-acetyltransferase
MPAAPHVRRSRIANRAVILFALLSMLGVVGWPEESASLAKKDHWAFKPPVRPAVPAVKNRDWPRCPIDNFVLARLEAEQLAPSQPADRVTLFRRLSFDLTGLPPTPEEVGQFVSDKHPDAYEKIVDRLLNSPRYGERWGRHWLDAVHYGESHGYDKDKPRPNAWPYRDYVIRSLNQDTPYSRFVQEQLAGDALFPDSADGVVATGFIAAGPWDYVGHVELPESKADGLIARYNDRDDMVMNTMSTFLSLTVHCARCHDHKFDPISQQEYYGLQAVFAGGVQSLSMTPLMNQRIPGPELKFEERWMPPTHPETPDAPCKDMSITVGWNTAQAVGITREEMDAWAARSHQRAIAAIGAGKFVDEIIPLKVQQFDGSVVDFSVDEHPRRDTTVEKLAELKVLHPEIEGFSITAGNSSGTNDAAAAVALVDYAYADAEKLTKLATVKAWAAAGVAPRDCGLGAVKVIGKVLQRAGLKPSDVALWEINEAFASVPIAACREYGLDEELVNFSGSGCSLGHPIAASGARMVTTLVYELQRRGGGIGVAAMCAGGGQGGAVVIEV